LNLFAYTGAFSVAAASGGATHVTSVDLSDGVLAWARDNFALNQLPADAHTTVADDAMRFVSSAVAGVAPFDLAIVDPPSFSAAREGAFAIDKDYVPLLAAVCRVLAPSGDLWLATNTRGFSLIGAAQLALARAGRRGRLVALGGLPPDYPTEPADADARYLQTCLLRLG
jgi:23S rRNA (cytosine1962-C5)-methyltransferase